MPQRVTTRGLFDARSVYSVLHGIAAVSPKHDDGKLRRSPDQSSVSGLGKHTAKAMTCS
jgi:hypothetical protein